jgi:protein-S-isoprenylcysteine O-methyltransferase Ste14
MEVATALPRWVLDPWPIRRSLGFTIGVAVHLLFAYTVWRLFWFLRAGASTTSAGPSGGGSLLINVALALQFSIPHSALLHPSVRRRISKWVAPAFYGLFYTTVSCLSLLTVISCWQTVDPILWRTTGAAQTLCVAGFYLSWTALCYSLHLTGIGYQTGLTPWLAWLRGEPAPRREFKPRGAYRFVRHPVYLSFLGLIWFTPTMTLDHAALTAVWTAYLFVGSWLKDRRLEFFIGEAYRDYERRVPGYPLMPVSPLGRRLRPASLAESRVEDTRIAA